MPLKLIADLPITESLDYLIEEKNKDGPSTLYVKGPYLMAEDFNKNRRKYSLNEMKTEVDRFTREMIAEKRALGELEHPQSASINSERACHMILELKQEGNVFIGKSKVLSTPMGLLVRSLILDDVKLGMSSRSLGKLVPLVEGHQVQNMRLVTVDLVADPSYPKAFVNGILESKQYVVNADGTLEESYDAFEDAISNLPRKDVDAYLREQVMAFLRNLK
jgi:hypothetical protein